MSGIIWSKKKINGVTYDLTHLNAFVVDVIPGDCTKPTFKVAVSFDLHTVTRERADGDRPDLFMGVNGDPRSFCSERYKCSLHLHDLIQRAASGNVLISHGGKYLIVGTIPVVRGEYAAVFILKKSQWDGIDARMFVISAHERKKPLAAMERISFYTLVRKTIEGQTPKKK